MKLETKHFGTIEVDEENIITFPDGIPGFEEETEFTIIQNPDENLPFHWLQAVKKGELAFVIMNPFIFRPDYDIHLPKGALEKLNIEDKEQISLWTIVRVPEKVEEMTANLSAPIVINNEEKLGKQVALDNSPYGKRHEVIKELKESQSARNANSNDASKGGV